MGERIEKTRRSILAAFAKVKDAPFIIWDVRANIGGYTPVALDIAAGMPGARFFHVARCGERIPGADPTNTHNDFDYWLAPAGPFTYDGKVAVLIDGLSISAADYFARAAAYGTDAVLVGTPTAGSYGGGAYRWLVASKEMINFYYDPWRCTDAAGRPLETHGVKPDVFVEQDPRDLAAGIDTQLEAAVDLLLAK